MDTKLKELQAAAMKFAHDAKAIAEKADAEGRSMSDAERAEFDGHMAKGAELLTQIKAVKADVEVLAKAKALADEIGPLAVDDVEAQGRSHDVRERVKSLGLQVVESKAFKDLAESFPGGRIPDRARVQSAPIPVKGLFVGSESTSAGAFVTPEDSGIVEMLGRRDLTIRDVISVRRTGSDVVEYVEQTAHTNNAAPVAEATSADGPTYQTEALDGDAAEDGVGVTVTLDPNGGYKPEGSWTFARRSANVVTIAEWVPSTKRALADVAQLEGLINDELRADLAEAEENQIVAGDGQGENLTGILEWSGIQTKAFTTDIFTSVRKALTKARSGGRVQPNAVLLHPSDVETIDLARESSTGKFIGSGPFALGPRTLWGVPIVESSVVTEHIGLVGDFRKAVLWDREQTTVTISDSHADFFIRNMVAILAEERVAFAVTRPTAFVKVGLTSGAGVSD